MACEQDDGSALLIVDVQRDFVPGGALAVPGGDTVVPVLNRYLASARPSRWSMCDAIFAAAGLMPAGADSARPRHEAGQSA